ELQELALEPGQDLEAGRSPGEPRLRRRLALGEGVALGGLSRGASLDDRGLELAPEQPLRLERELVEEGGQPVDDEARLERGDLRAGGGGGLALEDVAAGRLAREAALEREQAPQVGSQEQPAQVLLDEDLDRLVAELLVEALRRRIRARAGVHERARAGVGIEP